MMLQSGYGRAEGIRNKMERRNCSLALSISTVNSENFCLESRAYKNISSLQVKKFAFWA